MHASRVSWWRHCAQPTDCDEPSASRPCRTRGVAMARPRAVAKPGDEKLGRALRRIHAGTAAVVMSVRAYFSREQRNRRAILRDRLAERTAEATGVSLSVVTHLSKDAYRAGLPLGNTPETRDRPKRVPPGEVVRVREAI